MVTHKAFEAFILTCIFISSVALALDKPKLDPHSSLAKGLAV